MHVLVLIAVVDHDTLFSIIHIRIHNADCKHCELTNNDGAAGLLGVVWLRSDGWSRRLHVVDRYLDTIKDYSGDFIGQDSQENFHPTGYPFPTTGIYFHNVRWVNPLKIITVSFRSKERIKI